MAGQDIGLAGRDVRNGGQRDRALHDNGETTPKSHASDPNSPEDSWMARQRVVTIPVTVVATKRALTATRWGGFRWRIDTVLVDTAAMVGSDQTQSGKSGADSDIPIREPLYRNTPDSDAGSCRTDSAIPERWSGLSVVMYRDSCERYWHALIGDHPRLYILCLGEDEAQQPVRASIDYDEALAWSETDGIVVDYPLPAPLYLLMERFVLTHYRPRQFRKRKRKAWVEQP